MEFDCLGEIVHSCDFEAGPPTVLECKGRVRLVFWTLACMSRLQGGLS